MQTIIQHNLNTKIAEKISNDFQVLSTHIRHQTTTDLEVLRRTHKTDFNYLPTLDFSQIKLFLSDMDSTIINIECIDEIADFAGVKPQVADITQRAMEGELDFDTALIKRVELLKGLDKSVLDRVYTERLWLNLGAQELVDFLKTQSIKTAVVSGGFDYFTQRLALDIGLEHHLSNQLEIKNHKLTGKVIPPIINAQAKADFVAKLGAKYALDNTQIMVAGDGANDLLMMKIAGLSVAYNAKPMVCEQADIVINVGGLDKIMDFFHN